VKYENAKIIKMLSLSRYGNAAGINWGSSGRKRLGENPHIYISLHGMR
jgi:hypothetical protein